MGPIKKAQTNDVTKKRYAPYGDSDINFDDKGIASTKPYNVKSAMGVDPKTGRKIITLTNTDTKKTVYSGPNDAPASGKGKDYKGRPMPVGSTIAARQKFDSIAQQNKGHRQASFYNIGKAASESTSRESGGSLDKKMPVANKNAKDHNMSDAGFEKGPEGSKGKKTTFRPKSVLVKKKVAMTRGGAETGNLDDKPKEYRMGAKMATSNCGCGNKMSSGGDVQKAQQGVVMASQRQTPMGTATAIKRYPTGVPAAPITGRAYPNNVSTARISSINPGRVAPIAKQYPGNGINNYMPGINRPVQPPAVTFTPVPAGAAVKKVY